MLTELFAACGADCSGAPRSVAVAEAIEVRQDMWRFCCGVGRVNSECSASEVIPRWDGGAFRAALRAAGTADYLSIKVLFLPKHVCEESPAVLVKSLMQQYQKMD